MTADGGSRELAQLLDDATRRLHDAGVPSPRHDAEVLLAHALDVERRGLASLVVLGSRADVGQVAAFDELVERRRTREPLQHVTGRAPFRRIELSVGPGVFVPRPETELVAGHVIEHLQGRQQPCVVVDLCSGSGAIALSVASEVDAAQVIAVELDDDAVLWLKRNVEELGLQGRVTVVHADATCVSEALPSLVGACDVVVSNPPYVPDDAVIRDPEVLAHDPARALWGGADGLDVVRGIERQAAVLLVTGGLLVLEHADVQGESLPSLLVTATDESGAPTWVEVADHVDLAERPRFTTAVRDGAA